MLKILLICCLCFLPLFAVINCENNTTSLQDGTGNLFERGRTFVHHTLKRFMILAPAIFFKLGVAFTLLILVTLVAVNNGFIGFLILVVGLSSVLSRLQGSPAPLVQPVSYGSLSHHHPWIGKRSDSIPINYKGSKNEQLQNYNSNDDFRNTGVYYKGQYGDLKV